MEPAEIAAITTNPDEFAEVLARRGFTTTVSAEADGTIRVEGHHSGGLCLLVAYAPHTRRALRATALAPARRQVRAILPVEVEDFVLAAMSCQCPPCWRWLATWFDPDSAAAPAG
jgi:hypothetical protein